MNGILTQLGEYGIIPVIKIDDVNNALPLAKALCAGGLPVAEITFRTSCAKDAIATITREIPNMLVGAGTVLTCEQADDAAAAGAKFIVSPGFNPKVVRHCKEKGIPITPGCSSPTDIEAAIELGLEVVKFFPAEAAGGLEMIKAMSAPYGNMKFIPTGGINEKNILSYLQFDKVLACGGSFMVRDEYIKNGEFDKITELTREALSIIYGFELIHIGVNSKNEAECRAHVNLISTMFNLKPRETATAIFCGKYFEFMKNPFLGTNGHIAVGTNFADRAIRYFERMGFKFNYDEVKYDEKGKVTVAYFAGEYFGFALHLIQKQ